MMKDTCIKGFIHQITGDDQGLQGELDQGKENLESTKGAQMWFHL